MKRRYIIIGAFLNVGGAQVYARNKTDYLKKNGWKVDVYTGQNGILEIKDMEEYCNNFYPELSEYPFYISASRRDALLELICEDNDYDEIIVESNKRPFAVWGEMIAARLRAKHLFFCLEEMKDVHFMGWEYSFFDFKHRRRELAGIELSSLRNMFGNYKTISDEESYYLYATDENISSDVECKIELPYKTEETICIGCISRLDKNNVISMIDEIIIYAKSNRDIRIIFILIGDTPYSEIRNNIKKKLSEVSNIIPVMTGYLYPVPSLIIDYVDIFLCSSGAALATAALGKITITTDVIHGKSLGIMGYDIAYDESVFADENRTYRQVHDALGSLRDKAERERIEKDIKSNFSNVHNNYMIEFDNHMRFIDSSDKSLEYYDFTEIADKEYLGYMLSKDERILRVYDEWIRLESMHINISDILLKKGYKRICIYGLGHLGMSLLRSIRDSDVEVVELVDGFVTYNEKGLDVHKGIKFDNDPDAVIVTAIDMFGWGKLQLRGKYITDCDVVWLEDLITLQKVEN